MAQEIKKMLVVAPHPDDCILGVGGVMAKFAKSGGEVTVLVIASHQPPLFSIEHFRKSVQETKTGHELIGVKESIFKNIPAMSLDKYEHIELNKIISETIEKIQPDILFIPFMDRNNDHKAVFSSAMVSSRPFSPINRISIVAAYEVLSSTHLNAPYIEPNFIPNWVVDISDVIETKTKAMSCCQSQIGPVPHPRSIEAVKALSLFRGSQSGMNYGEAFQIIRMSLLPGV